MKKHTKRTLDLVSKQIIISMFDEAVSFSTKHVPHSHEWLSCGWEIFYFSNLFNCETPSNPSCDTQEKIKYLSFWGCCRCVYFVVNSFFYCTGSRCPGDAFRNRENHFPPVSHCCLPKGEFDVHYYYYLNFYFSKLLWTHEPAPTWTQDCLSLSFPQAFPLEVTKLIYCSRTVPEIEKVSQLKLHNYM